MGVILLPCVRHGFRNAVSCGWLAPFRYLLDASDGIGYQERMAGTYGFLLQSGGISRKSGGFSPSVAPAVCPVRLSRLFDRSFSDFLPSSFLIASGFT